MKAKDIVVGGKYVAKVSGKLVTVLVQQIYERSTTRAGRPPATSART